jgi:hypothetical protein
VTVKTASPTRIDPLRGAANVFCAKLKFTVPADPAYAVPGAIVIQLV